MRAVHCSGTVTYTKMKSLLGALQCILNPRHSHGSYTNQTCVIVKTRHIHVRIISLLVYVRNHTKRKVFCSDIPYYGTIQTGSASQKQIHSSAYCLSFSIHAQQYKTKGFYAVVFAYCGEWIRVTHTVLEVGANCRHL